MDVARKHERVLGLIPARLIADRRHAVLSPRPVLIVVIAGLAIRALQVGPR